MATSAMQKVLIIGGGFGGVFTARHLQRQARGRIAVELISRNNFFVFQPLLPEVAGGGIHPADAVVPLRLFLPGVTVRVAEVRTVDLAKKTVHVAAGRGGEIDQLAYDHLVIALGQVVDLSRTPGLAERALVMKDVTDAFHIRNHVLGCLEEAATTKDARRRTSLLTFAVIGGGFTGVETVGEVQDLIRKALRFYSSVRAADIRIVLLQHGARILPELPETLAAYAADRLRRRGVEILVKTGVKAVDLERIETDTGQTIDAGTIIAAMGNAPSPLVQRLPLPRAHGQILVDRHLRVRDIDHVWALGDNALIPLDDADGATAAHAPALAQFAYREAKVLAANILACLDDRPLTPFVYRSLGTMASLGGRQGVAEVLGMKFSGFLAWLAWRLFYLSLIPGLSTRVRIATDWLLDLIVSRSIVEIRAGRSPSGFVRYFAGEVVVEPGVESGGVYVVVSGQFRIDAPDDPATPPRVLTAGSWFGNRFRDQALATNEQARADTDAVAYFVAQEDLARLATVRALIDDHHAPSPTGP